MKKQLKIVVLFLLGICFLLEIFLRFPVSEEAKTAYYFDAYYRKVLHRVNPVWFRKKQDNPLLPPFDVYANLQVDEPERLTRIRDTNRVLKNTSVQAYDFLRHENLKDRTQVTAHFNNLGLRRETDTSIEKPKGTFRILVYGSYHAFGFGLPESATYSSILEDLLNQEAKKTGRKIKFEVLNSGRMAGTAIVGYAQFSDDVEKLKPDLAIFDYGIVDAFIIDDNLMPFVMHTGDNFKKFLQIPAGGINYLIGNSILFYKLWSFIMSYKIPQNIFNYFDVLHRFLFLAQQKKIPVIVLHQLQSAVPRDISAKVVSGYPDSHYADAKKIFEKEYANYKEIPKTDTFWLNEVDEEARAYIEKHPWATFSNLRLNIWQINEQGHSLLAHDLFKTVKDISK